MWKCSGCGESIEDNFEVCWNCKTSKDGDSPDHPTPDELPRELAALRELMSKSPDEHLRRIVGADSDQYGEEAVLLAQDELDRRHRPKLQPEASVRALENEQRSASRVLNRYLDLYRIARVLVGIGNIVKVIGIVVAGIILMIGLVIASSMGGAGFLLGAVVGAVYGGIIFLLGLLISAQGQMLLVQADSAVHTSPFMTDEEKAKVMSL